MDIMMMIIIIIIIICCCYITFVLCIRFASLFEMTHASFSAASMHSHLPSLRSHYLKCVYNLIQVTTSHHLLSPPSLSNALLRYPCADG
jgi:hypothetical protein